MVIGAVSDRMLREADADIKRLVTLSSNLKSMRRHFIMRRRMRDIS